MKKHLSNFLAAQLIVWNVGQGQWVTEVSHQSCIHFDLGGEKDVSKEALQVCKGKNNILFLSHWDWDHISFSAKFAAKSLNACLAQRPLGTTADWKKRQIERIPLCEGKIRKSLYTPDLEKNKNTANELSEVFVSQDSKILLPGDSPSSQEKKWIPRLSHLRIEGLILGHHGSRTSTSENLLRALPYLKWTVASSRKEKYGHPHAQVVLRLNERHIPLLRTEDWGNLHFLR